MKARLGFIGIVVEDRKRAAGAVNEILSDHGDIILGRMGLPHQEHDVSVVMLIVKTTTDELGRLTERLVKVPGVSV